MLNLLFAKLEIYDRWAINYGEPGRCLELIIIAWGFLVVIVSMFAPRRK